MTKTELETLTEEFKRALMSDVGYLFMFTEAAHALPPITNEELELLQARMAKQRRRDDRLRARLEYQQDYYERNRAARLAYRENYYERNRERELERQRTYDRATADARNERRRAKYRASVALKKQGAEVE